MANPSDLILGVLFKAKEDPQFKTIVRRLNSILTEFNKGMDKVDKAQKKLTKSTKDLSKATKDLNKDMKKTADVTDATGKQIGKITKGIDRLIAAFKVVAVYTVAGRVFQGFQTAVRAGVKEIIDFDQALANLKAITGATDQEIQSMRDTLKDTALRTKFSTTEIAEGMVLLGQAGLSGAESIQAIDAVADLAAGTLSDFRSVSDLVTTTLRAFNMEASETRRIADVMANAVNKSKLTIDKLRTAFNYVGAGAHQAGLSLEQTAASMMILANNGLRASTIGTGLRQVLSRLLAPNAKLREAMSRYGLELDKATGQSGWFTDQLGKLSTVMYDFEKGTVDMSRAYTLFGLRGAQAAAILINAYNDLDGTWEIMLERASQVGTATEMMQRQAEGLGFKIKNLADSFGVLAINLGEAGLGSAIRFTVDQLRDLVKWMGEGVQLTVGRATTTFIGLAGALYTVQLAFQAVKKALIMKDKALLVALKAFFFGPWGWAILGIAGAAAGITALVSAVNKSREAFNKQAIEAQKVVTSIETYRKQIVKVKEGTAEWDILIARLKQALPDYVKEIDKVSGSYETLVDFLDKLNKAQKELSISATGEAFFIDLQQSLEYATKSVDAGVIADPLANLLKKGLDRNDPKVQQLISDFVQFIYGTYAKELKKGASLTEVQDAITNLFMPEGAYEKINREFPEVVKEVLGKLDEMFNKYEERRKKQAEERLKREREFVDSLPKMYRDFIDMLVSTKQYSTLLKFLDKVGQAREGWEKKKQEWEAYDAKNDKTKEQRAKDLHILYMQFIDDELKAFLDANSKKGGALNKLLTLEKQIAKLRSKSTTGYESEFAKLDAFYSEMYGRITELVDKGKLSNEKAKEYLLIMWAAFYKQLQTIAQKYGLPAHMDPKVVESLGKIGVPAGVGEVPAPTGELTPDFRGMPKGMTPEEKEKYDKRYKGPLDKITKQRTETEYDETNEAYRRGEATAEQYFEAIDRMEKEGLMTHKEAVKKRETETNSLWENLKAGWKDYFGEMQTVGEFVQEFAGDLVDQLSTGFADAWGDFLTGTKDAKEAFADFARDMLRWLAQIAMKRAMTAIFGSMFHGGGMYGEGGAQRRIKSPMFLPKLHNGLMPDEFAAILRKDEAVFTPKQLKALSGMIKGTTEINVPVNIDGGNGDRMGRYLPSEIEQTVLKVMRKYM